MFGWAQVLKATLYFLVPACGMRCLRRIDPEKPHYFVVGGVSLMALVGMVIYGWL